MDTTSHPAQQALSQALVYLASQGALADDRTDFSVRTIEQDALGMTHVRLDRLYDGLKVFPDQVIVHLGRTGAVQSLTGALAPLPAGLATATALVTERDVVALALAEFGAVPDGPPTAERVVTRNEQGEYVVAYRVICEQMGALQPRRQNYLIDAGSGRIIKSWNEVGGIGHFAAPAVASALRSPPGKAHGAAAPNAAIPDPGKVQSTIHLDGDFTIDQLQLNVDIRHTYRGDLTVTLTSPSGEQVVLSSREGTVEDDIIESYDLGRRFHGKPVAGDWTLTVEDFTRADAGVFKAWNLTAVEEDPNPPPPPPQTTDDRSLYSAMVGLGATENPDGTFRLFDTTRGAGVRTVDAMNHGQDGRTVEVHDDDNLWGEASDSPRQAAAVDAQYGAQSTYDFYRDILGRDSIDGRGEALVSKVHVRENYVNCFWDGKSMNYGDGDGRVASSLTTLDLAGHEITHGLNQRTADLIYGGESGALSESMSDIVGGAGVEWYALQRNPALQGIVDPYRMGEQCWTPGTDGDAIRYMADPTADRRSIDHYGKYTSQLDVHYTSGIANNAFYLLTNGGTNKTSGVAVADAIGMEKGLKIFGRALIFYMTPETTFAQAREACIKAAADLYGQDSVEVAKVQEAWTAVGVA